MKATIYSPEYLEKIKQRIGAMGFELKNFISDLSEEVKKEGEASSIPISSMYIQTLAHLGTAKEALILAIGVIQGELE